MLKNITLMLAIAASTQLPALNAQIYSETFQSGYIAGPLAGQNGWAQAFGGSPTPSANVIVDPSGNYITSADNSYSILNAGNFKLSTSDTITLTFDLYLGESGANALFGIGNYDQVSSSAGMPPMFGVQGGNWVVRGWSFGTTVLARHSNGSVIAASVGVLYRVRSVWDLSGSGSATLSIMNLTAGDTQYTQLFFNSAQTQATASLELGNANNPGVDQWEGVAVRTSHNARIDNLTVVPEPRTAALAIAGACVALALLRRRKK